MVGGLDVVVSRGWAVPATGFSIAKNSKSKATPLYLQFNDESCYFATTCALLVGFSHPLPLDFLVGLPTKRGFIAERQG